MDVEKIVILPYNTDLTITIPAKTKANIESGHYLTANYESFIFEELTGSSKIVRYKRYVCCNRYIYDLKNEELIAFCKLADWHMQDDEYKYLVYYVSRYNLLVKPSTVLWDYLEYNYYNASPKTKLEKTVLSELNKLGFDKQRLIDSVNLTIQQTVEVV